ncbi:hypothetical protein TrST_g13342 [Triparma strigata]|uniref:Uncharacterized protein n=1 Tax=Triparma strigata TaxID=1606541 RepID=A0A9W7BTP1_9STRA|nr:hypothetical protein TrST_g13342 [Triparma strigata]
MSSNNNSNNNASPFVLPGDVLNPYLPPISPSLEIVLSPTIIYDSKTVPNPTFKSTVKGYLKITQTQNKLLLTIPQTLSPTPTLNMELLALIKTPSTQTHHLLTVPNFPSHTFLLPPLSFPGATKRNKPTLKFDDVIFCKVSSISANVVTCTCKSEGDKDWVTGISSLRLRRNRISQR